MGETKVAPGSDRTLVVEFQRGEDSAFDEIFKRYHGRVSAICYRMLGSPQDAEEATQETFLKAYQALGRFNGNYYLGAWLGRIATNVCLDHLRARSRTNLVALPEEREDLLTEESPEDVVVGDHPRLQQAIKEIQPLHASALALRALEGMSHREIAGRLEMSPAQVKALLHRARSSLRRAWDKAEGWVAAPLLGLRELTTRNSADAGRLFSLSHGASPLLMERVAASAMIVAAALTGLPSEMGPVEHGGRDAVRIPPAAAQRSESDTLAVERRDTVSSNAEEDTVETDASTEEAPATVTDKVLGRVDKVLDAPRGDAPGDEPRTDDDPEDSPLGPHAAEGAKAVKKAQKVVRHVEESLAP